MITKFDIFNESVRDMMTPVSQDKVKELHDKGIYPGKITTDGYTEKQAKSIIKSFSKKLNNNFEGDTPFNTKTSWTYRWRIPYSKEPSDSIMVLLLSLDDRKYQVYFSDRRDFNLKTFLNSFSSETLDMDDFKFSRQFDYLEDALDWLKRCNIDTSKITRK